MDFAILQGWLDVAIKTVILLQQVIQGRWFDDHPLLCLPHTNFATVNGIGHTLSIPQLQQELRMDQLQETPNEKQLKYYETWLVKRTPLEFHEAKNVCFFPTESFYPIFSVYRCSFELANFASY